GVGAVLLSKGEEAEVRAGTPFGIQLTQALSVGDTGYTESSPEPSRSSERDYGRGVDRDANPTSDRDSGVGAERTRGRDYPETPGRGGRADSRNPDARGANPPPDSASDSDSPDRSQPVADPAAEQLPLSSPEMIRRAQSALRDQGYYEGEINGTMGS